MEEFIQWILTLKVDDKDDALCANLRTKFILTESNAWNYMAWDAQAKCLRPTKYEPQPGERIKEILILLARLGTNTELIH